MLKLAALVLFLGLVVTNEAFYYKDADAEGSNDVDSRLTDEILQEIADIKEDQRLTPEQKDAFILGLIHHAVRGVVGVAHHAVNFVGRVVGDEQADEILQETPEQEDAFLGHLFRAVGGIAHHAVNLVGHVLVGDEQE